MENSGLEKYLNGKKADEKKITEFFNKLPKQQYDLKKTTPKKLRDYLVGKNLTSADALVSRLEGFEKSLANCEKVEDETKIMDARKEFLDSYKSGLEPGENVEEILLEARDKVIERQRVANEMSESDDVMLGNMPGYVSDVVVCEGMLKTINEMIEREQEPVSE